MTIASLIIAIIALLLSIWNTINILFISKTLNLISDVFELKEMKDILRRGEELSSEQLAEFERIMSERSRNDNR